MIIQAAIATDTFVNIFLDSEIFYCILFVFLYVLCDLCG